MFVVATINRVAVDRLEQGIIRRLEEIAIVGRQFFNRRLHHAGINSILGQLTAEFQQTQQLPWMAAAELHQAIHLRIAGKQTPVGSQQQQAAHRSPSGFKAATISLIQLHHRQDNIGIELAAETPVVFQMQRRRVDHQGFDGQQLLRILHKELLGIFATHLVGAIDQKQQLLGPALTRQLGLCQANQSIEGQRQAGEIITNFAPPFTLLA